MPTKDKQNLSIWENVRQVDRKYTKPITGKGYKGDSINPTWMVMKATEVLGPIGRSVRLGASVSSRSTSSRARSSTGPSSKKRSRCAQTPTSRAPSAK